MDTTPGRDAFALVKARGPKLEWSYGYSVLNPPEVVTVGGRKANALRRVRVDEVSPVWRGAGLGTRTWTRSADDPARANALHERGRFARMGQRHAREAGRARTGGGRADPGRGRPAAVAAIRARGGGCDPLRIVGRGHSTTSPSESRRSGCCWTSWRCRTGPTGSSAAGGLNAAERRRLVEAMDAFAREVETPCEELALGRR